MFCQLDEPLNDKISAGDADVLAFVEEALVAHRMSNIILVFSRSQMRLMEGSPHLSLSAKKTLALISQRSNDYRSAMAISTRVIVICDDTRTLSVLVAGKFAYVNVGLLRGNHILIQSFLLCENLTDVQFYSIMAKAYFSYGKYPESYVMMRPVAGGGSTLFQALHAEQAHPLKGMLICDPDTLSLVPPFKHGSTAAHAFDAAVSLNGCDCTGINDVNPMFGFYVTPGLSMENAIGPNLLEIYFQANARQTERQAILNAFPNFPIFTPEEWVLWHSLDLKNGTRTLTKQFELVRDRFGSVPASMLARSKALTLAKVPSDMFRWVVENNSLSRWARAIEIAFRQDFANHEYEMAMGPICDGVRTLLAGDSTARRS